VPVSIVLCVLNEQRHLAQAVANALDQDHSGPLELVIALGPSRDRTDEIAAELMAADPRIRCVRNPDPTGSTPAGLNAALAATRHPVVVRIDGHSLLPREYVRIAVETMRETGADNVGGIMAAEGDSAFEKAVARAMTSRFGVGNASFHTGGEAGQADTVYLGVFRRSALERVGGYDETFLRAQDWEMNLRIRRTGGLVWFQPKLRVSYRPRSTVRTLGRQYFHYGRWRRVVMRRHEGTVNFRRSRWPGWRSASAWSPPASGPVRCCRSATSPPSPSARWSRGAACRQRPGCNFRWSPPPCTCAGEPAS